MDWKELNDFCQYLENARFELDKKIIETQNEVIKLQDIFDGITPRPMNDPHEELHPKAPITKSRIFRGFEQPVQRVQSSADPYSDFLHYFDEYKRLPQLQRTRPQERFLKRIMDFSRMTPAQMYSRLIPSVQEINRQLDKILSFNVEQPNLRYRGLHLIESAERIITQYQKYIQEFGLTRRVDLKQFELKMENDPPKKKKPAPVEKFETVANLTPKQLNAIYSLRGNARRAVMELNIKEKAEKAFVSFTDQANSFYDADDDDLISILKTCSRGYRVLVQNPRYYSIVVRH